MEYNENEKNGQQDSDGDAENHENEQQQSRSPADIADDEENFIVGSETGLFKGSFKKKQQYNFEDRRWLAMSQAKLQQIATIDRGAKDGKKLTGVDFRVFFYVTGVLDYENYLKVTTTSIADAIGMQPQNVSRSLAKLTEYGILLRGKKSSKSYTYRLNPNFGYKGKAKSQKDAVEEMAKNASKGGEKPNLSLVRPVNDDQGEGD